jgi:hypothetical protein
MGFSQSAELCSPASDYTLLHVILHDNTHAQKLAHRVPSIWSASGGLVVFWFISSLLLGDYQKSDHGDAYYY